jgi:hypothetical protein
MAQISTAPHIQPIDLRTTATALEVESAPLPRVVTRATIGVLSFGVALGITNAIAVFLLGLTTALAGWGILVVQVLSTLYIGYEPTLLGAITGAVWAFVDAFIGGILLAWIYNKLVRRHIVAA